MVLLAVYGTLRRGVGDRFSILEYYGAKYIGKGKVHGYEMYLVPSRAYPFAVPNNDSESSIVVEVYDVDEDILRIVDGWEVGYDRKQVIVRLDNGKIVKAMMYVWMGVIINEWYEKVNCGDFVVHINGMCGCNEEKQKQ